MTILMLDAGLTPDVPQGESFAERVAQYLADVHQAPVVLDLATPGCGADVLHGSYRPPLHLADYDLILLTPGIIQRTGSWLGGIRQVRQLGAQTRQLLNLLRPHRERVLVLGPTPCLPLLVNGFRRWANQVLAAICRRHAVQLVSGFEALPRQEFLFKPGGLELNHLGHHYLALSLIDCLNQRIGEMAV